MRYQTYGGRYFNGTLQAVGDLDLVPLGLDGDGHTASLFPDHEWGTALGLPDTMALFDAPKPPPRVSLTAMRLSRARQVLFLVSGQSKHGAVAEWRRKGHSRAGDQAGGRWRCTGGVRSAYAIVSLSYWDDIAASRFASASK